MLPGMKSLSPVGILGLILCVAGAALLIYGIVTYSNLQDSLGNRLVSALGGNTDQEKQALGFMIGGGAGIVVGAVLFITGKKKKGSRKRK